MKKTWIYDLEVFREIFTATFIDKDSDETKVFVITKDRDDRKEFFNFLSNESNEVIALIGYNNLHYDSQIIEYFLKNFLFKSVFKAFLFDMYLLIRNKFLLIFLIS